MSDTSDNSEAYEPFDEALDDADLPGHGGGPGGERELDRDLVVDRTALHEIGADLDDPDGIALLDGGMDDPDGAPPSPRPTGPERPMSEPYGDPELEFVETDPDVLAEIPDDAPGPDSARW